MSDCMTFPDTVEEFMDQYKIIDTKQVYTNGTEFVPIFRMKQWFEHLPSSQPEKAQLSQEDATFDCISRQPERKKGKWVECDHEKWIVGVHALRCSECNGGYHLNNEMTIYYWNFCPNCGADMREGEKDDE